MVWLKGWMKLVITLCIAILLLFIFGEIGEAETQESLKGEKIYRNHCMVCHGAHLEGGLGPVLEHVGSFQSKEQIHFIITNGRGTMPPFANYLDEGSIQILAEWLSSKK
jgi:mono/diheme cytochrome c family protein